MTADIVTKAIIYNPRIKRVLLLQRAADDDTGAGTWENAGGNIEENEAPEAAVLREISEETGIADISVSKVAYVVLAQFSRPVLIIAYLCETDTDAVVLSNEHQAFLWADKADCLKLLPEGIIKDFEKNGIFDLI